MAKTHLPGSYQAGLVQKGYTDNGDGSFTSPTGDRLTPQMSEQDSANLNDLAGRAHTALVNGYGSTDPTFDPRYGMLSAEHALDPTDTYFKAPSGTTTDNAGNLIDKPEGFWAKYGPWLALAGAGGLIAAPEIAGALGAGGGASAAATPAVSGATNPAVFSGLFGAELPGTTAAGAGTVAATSGGLYSGLFAPTAAATGTAGAAGSGILGAAKALSGGKMTLGDVLDAAGKIGRVASGYAANAASGRVQQAAMQQRQDQNALDAATLALKTPGARMGNAVRGDILANAQPFAFNGTRMMGDIPVPTSTGGLSPALFSAATRSLGATVPQQMLDAEQADGGNPVSLTPLPTPSKLDSVLGAAGLVGSLGGGVGEAMKPTPSIVPPKSAGTQPDPVDEYLQRLLTGGGRG